MRRNDRARPRGDSAFELAHIHAEGVIAIDEDRPCADLANGSDRGDERVRGGNDIIACPDAERLERQFDGVSTGVDADGVARADEVREPAFELLERLSE